MLLAVDVGLRSGFALYGKDGRLIRYYSQHFGAHKRLKKAIYGILRDISGLERVIAEGGGSLQELWKRASLRNDLVFVSVSAEKWRRDLLYPREQKTGDLAKSKALELAGTVITWSKAPKPTSMTHDAAEAILIGLWGVIQAGWLRDIPDELKRSVRNFPA